MSHARRWLSAAIAASCFGAPAARADDAAPPTARPTATMPARVDFERPACTPPSFDEAAFTKLLRIELATDGVRELRVRDAGAPSDESSGTETSLAVLALENACAPDGALAIAIDDAATNKRVRRVVELGPIPMTGRARVLALAAAELLRASWAELALPDAPPARTPVPPEVKRATTERLQRATAPAPAPPKAAAASPPTPSPDRLFMIATPEARFFFRERLGLAGLRVGPSIPLGRRTPLRLRVHAGSSYGAGNVDEGAFDAWLVTSGVGITGGGSSKSAALEFGPQFELGWGWRRLRASGDAGSPPADGDGVIASISILASGRAHLGGAWWSIADVELGQAAASDDGVTRTGGTTVGARLGVALSP